jgi:hypothetical protein
MMIRSRFCCLFHNHRRTCHGNEPQLAWAMVGNEAIASLCPMTGMDGRCSMSGGGGGENISFDGNDERRIGRSGG